MPPVKIKVLIFILLFCAPVFSEDRFKPWDADVNVADENFISVKKSDNQNIKVFSAAQGGGFFMIRAYQVFLSPQRGPTCPYNPSCSNYGRIAVLKYGLIGGSFLAGDRLLRCNPYNIAGYDPVPDFIFQK